MHLKTDRIWIHRQNTLKWPEVPASGRKPREAPRRGVREETVTGAQLVRRARSVERTKRIIFDSGPEVHRSSLAASDPDECATLRTLDADTTQPGYPSVILHAAAPGAIRTKKPEPERQARAIAGDPKGIRTPVTGVRGRCPEPLDEGSGTASR